ncbi:MAG: metal-dependent hydrolase [Sphingomonas sp.]|uniref:metal-dependent hydrolase n=1 Tax=Sphingomonas sp. TaxID=28214 RepID=UPI001856485F|nr:metal-dependent hydrolase [Sphingomonas sp.]MBA3667242.1 metal-dependent hydrolase [Sphingomonas sp.]
MDNFTHSLTGWALGQAGLKSKSRKGLAALILGANMPDIDIFFGWVGWSPLAMHRGFTHGLVGGVAVMPPFLAGLLWLLDRWQSGRGANFKSGLPMRFGWLIALSYIGAVSHPLLDLQNTYAVQLLSPFSDAWFHTDALFIIDVWLWCALALGIGWSRYRERGGGQWQQPAQVALLIAIAYIAANAGLSLVAKRSLAANGAVAHPDVLFAGTEPAFFWKRNLIWREGGRIGRASFGPLAGIHDVRPTEPDRMADPLVRRARRADPSLAGFLRWSVLPMASIERSTCHAAVSIGDARFGEPRVSARFVRKVVVPLTGPGCPLAKAR